LTDRGDPGFPQATVGIDARVGQLDGPPNEVGHPRRSEHANAPGR